MRFTVGAFVVVLLSGAVSAEAQQSDPPSPVSLSSVRMALQNLQQSSIWLPKVPQWVAPGPKRWGLLTFVPPGANGEMVKIVLPVGQLVSNAAQAFSNARLRRAERKARDEVLRTLKDFQAQPLAR